MRPFTRTQQEQALTESAMEDLREFVLWYASTYAEQLERDGYCPTVKQAMVAFLDREWEE